MAGRRVRSPLGEARRRLGAELRRIRTDARVTQRGLHGDQGSGHVSNVENGHTHPSWDFVERYLALGGDRTHVRSLFELARDEADTRRVDSRRRGAPAAEVVTTAPSSSDGLGFDELRRHYVVRERHETYEFGPDGVVSAVEVVSVVAARSEGTVLVGTAHAYDADPREGVLRVEPAQGCAIDRVEVAPTGSVRAYLRLDRAIGPDDDPVRIAFRLHVDSAVRTRPVVMCHPGPGTEALSLDVRFREPSVPAHAWWFATDNVVHAEMPGDHESVEPTAEPGRYHLRFDTLVRNWTYGLAWSWR